MAANPDRTTSRAKSRGNQRRRVSAWLRAVHPAELRSWETELSENRVVLGRRPDDGVALADTTVSRHHAALEWHATDRRHLIIDLDSRNGTRVDGDDIAAGAAVPLHDNAVIQLGDVLLVYENGRAPASNAGDDVPDSMIPGRALITRRLRASVARAARDPSPVLLTGETGTGKEWTARALHELSGRDGPLMAVNCSALSPQIIDSQLFGHVKGAFTGAVADSEGLFRAAHGGTLFLDEIGEMPLELQPKLLRALQEMQVQPVGSTRVVDVDVRVVAATNRPLDEEIEAGQFRRDLYARLALWDIRVPPLRDRRVDVVEWLERLHRRWCEDRDLRGDPLQLSADATEAILLCRWPDNLRGLDRLVHELGATPSPDGVVIREDLPAWLTEEPAARDGATATPPAEPPPARRKRRPAPSREDFTAVFERLDGNVRAMARHFGRDRRQIYRWLDAYGLSELRRQKLDESDESEG